MTQNEFFNIIMDELKDFPECTLYEITCYYQAYFSENLAYGKSEDEIIKELGDPVLIANKLIKENAVDNSFFAGPKIEQSSNSSINEMEISNSNTIKKSESNNFNINTILKLGIITLLILFFAPSLINIGSILLYLCKICTQLILRGLNLGYNENLNFFFHSPIVISDFILSLPNNSLTLFSIGTIFLSLSFMLIIFRLFRFVFITFKNLLYALKDKEA